MAGALVGTLPLLLVFAVFGKQIVGGIMRAPSRADPATPWAADPARRAGPCGRPPPCPPHYPSDSPWTSPVHDGSAVRLP